MVSTRTWKKWIPQGLYTRSLTIVIAPMVILQALLSYIFMERHWVLVTQKLTEATVNDIAFAVALYESLPEEERAKELEEAARQELRFSLSFSSKEHLSHFPAVRSIFAPFDFPRDFLRQTLAKRIAHPSSLEFDPSGETVRIRIDLGDTVLNVDTLRSRVVATNSHIFLVWMISISLVLIVVAILFLRNQLRPIKRLAEAAEQFGTGREISGFRPAGAIEVRLAARAFLTMRDRIKRQIEQRTILMAGISHDLRTLLTRFRLQLAMLGDKERDVRAMLRDVSEMEHILEMYLLFARDHRQEATQKVGIGELLEEIREESASPEKIQLLIGDDLHLSLRRNSIKRCLGNLVENADKRAEHIMVSTAWEAEGLEIVVEDDGPGIPEADREIVLEPFRRLDDSGNRGIPGSGLGLAIARDIARGHGGDVRIKSSQELGGVRVVVWLPVPKEAAMRIAPAS